MVLFQQDGENDLIFSIKIPCTLPKYYQEVGGKSKVRKPKEAK